MIEITLQYQYQRQESDVIMDLTTLMFLVFWLWLWSRNTAGQRSATQQQLFRGSSMWPSSYRTVSPTTNPHLASSLPTYHSTSLIQCQDFFCFVYTMLTNSRTAITGSCSTKVNFMPEYEFRNVSWFQWPNFANSVFFKSEISFFMLSSWSVLHCHDLITLDCTVFSSKRGDMLTSLINDTYPMFTCTHIYCITDTMMHFIHHF